MMQRLPWQRNVTSGRAGACPPPRPLGQQANKRRNDSVLDQKQAGVDKEAIKLAVVNLIEAIGDDVTREGLQETPRRIADMYEEIFQGLQQDPREVLQVGFDERHEEMVIVRDIPFYSLCEHHFMPFFGTFHIGYIPRGRVVGISKMARVV